MSKLQAALLLLATMVIEKVNCLFTSKFGQIPPYLVNNYQINITSATSKRKAAEDSATTGLTACHPKIAPPAKLPAQLRGVGSRGAAAPLGF